MAPEDLSVELYDLGYLIKTWFGCLGFTAVLLLLLRLSFVQVLEEAYSSRGQILILFGFCLVFFCLFFLRIFVLPIKQSCVQFFDSFNLLLMHFHSKI